MNGPNWQNNSTSLQNCLQENSDLPDLKDIKVMGYSVRSWNYRFTLWLGFNPTTFQVVESHTFLSAPGFVLDGLFKFNSDAAEYK